MNKFCKDCRYFAEPRRCRHDSQIDLVSGNAASASCDDMRKGACGPEGRFWWARDLPQPVLMEEARHDHRI